MQTFEELKQQCKKVVYNGFFGDYEGYSFDDCKKLINAKFDNTKKFIGVADYQGGEFCIGYVGTTRDYVLSALEWCDSDDNMELINHIINNLDDSQAMNYIQSVWDFEVEPYRELK